MAVPRARGTATFDDASPELAAAFATLIDEGFAMSWYESLESLETWC